MHSLGKTVPIFPFFSDMRQNQLPGKQASELLP